MLPLPSNILRSIYIKIFLITFIFVLIVQFASFTHSSFQPGDRFQSLSVPFPRPRPLPVPQFNSYGSAQCLPPVSHDLLSKSVEKHAKCSKYSPFFSPRTRIATVTAHFGGLEGNQHYTKAFITHLEHALVHGTEVHVLCDKMVDDLWNKPAFILDLLLREMAKSESKRLEWLVWVDRDTLILDQCRPATSFLPTGIPDALLANWWRRNEKPRSKTQSGDPTRSEDSNKPPPELNLIVTNDMNGLNNGIFFLRVSPWSISLFAAILAYRHYNPTVKLKFTEQSAMELVMRDDRFKDQVQLVPQYWFNAYSHGGPKEYVNRNNTKEEGLEDMHARRGDWLIHFAGNERKDEALNSWADMLENAKDIWEEDKVQRDISGEVRQFWEEKGFLP